MLSRAQINTGGAERIPSFPFLWRDRTHSVDSEDGEQGVDGDAEEGFCGDSGLVSVSVILVVVWFYGTRRTIT